MAIPAQPQQILGAVGATVRAVLDMMRVNTGAAFAQITGFVEVLEPELAEGVRVNQAGLFGEHHSGRLQQRHTPITGSSRVRS